MAEEEEWLVVSVVACLLLRTVSSWSYVFLPRGFIVQIEIYTSGAVFAESIQIWKVTKNLLFSEKTIIELSVLGILITSQHGN